VSLPPVCARSGSAALVAGLGNLLTNAAKYTDPEGSHISARIERGTRHHHGNGIS
jgi:signal transduction histidine kinase